MNVQSHKLLANRLWNMAQVLRDLVKPTDEQKHAILHLESLSMEHRRKAFVTGDLFIRA